jgi:hypothetical protein
MSYGGDKVSSIRIRFGVGCLDYVPRLFRFYHITHTCLYRQKSSRLYVSYQNIVVKCVILLFSLSTAKGSSYTWTQAER